MPDFNSLAHRHEDAHVTHADGDARTVMTENGDKDDKLAVIGRLPDADIRLAVIQAVQYPRRHPHEENNHPSRSGCELMAL